MSDQLDRELCGMCSLPIHPSETGVRYCGDHRTHSQSRCTQLLRAEVERLEAELARTKLERDAALLAVPSLEQCMEWADLQDQRDQARQQCKTLAAALREAGPYVDMAKTSHPSVVVRKRAVKLVAEIQAALAAIPETESAEVLPRPASEPTREAEDLIALSDNCDAAFAALGEIYSLCGFTLDGTPEQYDTRLFVKAVKQRLASPAQARPVTREQVRNIVSRWHSPLASINQVDERTDEIMKLLESE